MENLLHILPFFIALYLYFDIEKANKENENLRNGNWVFWFAIPPVWGLWKKYYKSITEKEFLEFVQWRLPLNPASYCVQNNDCYNPMLIKQRPDIVEILKKSKLTLDQIKARPLEFWFAKAKQFEKKIFTTDLYEPVNFLALEVLPYLQNPIDAYNLAFAFNNQISFLGQKFDFTNWIRHKINNKMRKRLYDALPKNLKI